MEGQAAIAACHGRTIKIVMGAKKLCPASRAFASTPCSMHKRMEASGGEERGKGWLKSLIRAPMTSV